jgi:hypothetical protein
MVLHNALALFFRVVTPTPSLLNTGGDCNEVAEEEEKKEAQDKECVASRRVGAAGGG